MHRADAVRHAAPRCELLTLAREILALSLYWSVTHRAGPSQALFDDHLWFISLGGLCSMTVGVIGVSPWSLRLDRTCRLMTVRRRFKSPQDYPLESITSLQVCSREFWTSSGASGLEKRTAFELNAVFAPSHEPRRVRLIAHAHEDSFFEQAQQLAEFLDVPLIRSDQKA